MSCEKLIECSASAPGKVILHGEHSVVFGKTAIAASFGLRCRTTLKELDSTSPHLIVNLPQLQIHNVIFKIESLNSFMGDIPLSETDNVVFNWSTPHLINHNEFLKIVVKYIDEYHVGTELKDTHRQGLVMVLYLFFCIINKNYLVDRTLEVTVDSELTIGAGTGSSASYAVSLSAAMLQFLRLKSPERYYSIMPLEEGKNNPDTFSDDEKRIISAWAFCSEKIAHGTPSGIDNTICTFGSLVEFRKGSDPIHHSLEVKLKVLLVNTCVARQTRILTQKVAGLKQRFPRVIDHIIEALDNIALSALRIVNDINTDATNQENAFEQLAELFDMNHCLLAALGVSHPSLENIRATSANFGFSSKLTGAGGGGYAIVLIPPSADDSKVERLMKELNDAGYIATITHLGGEGVTIDKDSN